MNFRQRNKALLLFLSLVMSLALLVWVSGRWAQAQAGSTPLFTPLTPDEQSGLPEHDTGLPATRQQYVSLNTAVLSANLAELELHLFADTVYTAVHERTDQYSNGTAVWVGQLPDQPQSDVSLSLLSGQLVGTINTGTILYAVRPVIGNVHVIQQLEPEYAPGLPPLVPSWDAIAAAHADLHDHSADFTLVPLETDSDLLPPPPIGISDPKADDGSTIDVLVVYTPAVRQAVGGTAATQALIALAISESNSGYDNSLVNFNLRLAHSTEVAYSEVGDFVTDLERVTYFDGHIDEVLTLRDQYRADVVVLLIDAQTFCGLAWLRTSNNPAFEGLAFSVTAYQCATGYYSFAHEIGHNMGSQHDRDNSSSPPLYNYGYGYQDNTNAFRTIMAYNCPNGGCVRVNRWSNPNVNYNGRSTGIDPAASNSAHNTLSLNNVAFSVANYRQSVPPTPTPTVTPSPTSTPTPTPTPTPLPTILATLQPDQSAFFDLGNFEIGFPMGVFTDDVELVLEGLSLDMLPGSPPEGLEASQYLMQVTAVYMHNGLPAQPQPGEQYLIDVVYDDAGRNQLKEPTLGLYRWDTEAGEWVLEATSFLDINTQTITANSSELTTWAVLGEGPERLFLPLVRASE